MKHWRPLLWVVACALLSMGASCFKGLNWPHDPIPAPTPRPSATPTPEPSSTPTPEPTPEPLPSCPPGMVENRSDEAGPGCLCVPPSPMPCPDGTEAVIVSEGLDANGCKTVEQQCRPLTPEPSPSAPPNPCVAEKRRGIGVQYVNRASRHQCKGTEECYRWFAQGKAQVGDELVLDSTALVTQGQPVVNGCGTCVEDPTRWELSGVTARLVPDGPCGLSVKFLARSVSFSIQACGSNPATCVVKPDKPGERWLVR